MIFQFAAGFIRTLLRDLKREILSALLLFVMYGKVFIQMILILHILTRVTETITVELMCYVFLQN